MQNITWTPAYAERASITMFLGLHRDTPVIKTLKKISASGAVFNETVLSRMQNIITFQMIGKSTNDDSFQYLRKDTSD